MEADEDNGVAKKDVRGGAVNLMTIHQSKGLEFDVVVVIDAMHTLMNSVP